MKALRITGKTLAGSAALLLLAPQAFAGSSVGSITHIGLSEVPALGGFGLLLLSGLLGVVSLRFLQAREKGRFLAIAALAGTLASAGGFNLVNTADAIIVDIELQGDKGSAIVDIPFDGFHTVINRSGGLRQITNISLDPGCVLADLENGGGNGGMMANGGNGGNGGSYRGQCNDEPGTRLEQDDFCEILVCCGFSNGGNGGCAIIE